MNNYEEYLYIDYENVQDVDVNLLHKNIKVLIILGKDQIKIPVDLIKKTQPFGNSIEWIQVNGKGRNALDFFIAFFLGKDVASNIKKTFIIYSKDTGYDPLVNYLKNQKINARRIVSFQELSKNSVIKVDELGINKVKESLLKVAANKRPKKRSSLSAFITSHLKNIPNDVANNIIEDLFIKKIVYEENGIIKYSLKNNHK